MKVLDYQNMSFIIKWHLIISQIAIRYQMENLRCQDTAWGWTTLGGNGSDLFFGDSK
jgi:hypothetical protein